MRCGWRGPSPFRSLSPGDPMRTSIPIFPVPSAFLPTYLTQAHSADSLFIYRILKGNLAPDGAVAKITGKEGLEFTGKARTFDTEDAFVEAVENGEIKKGEKTVAVLRYLGPKGGPGESFSHDLSFSAWRLSPRCSWECTIQTCLSVPCPFLDLSFVWPFPFLRRSSFLFSLSFFLSFISCLVTRPHLCRIVLSFRGRRCVRHSLPFAGHQVIVLSWKASWFSVFTTR